MHAAVPSLHMHEMTASHSQAKAPICWARSQTNAPTAPKTSKPNAQPSKFEKQLSALPALCREKTV
jgi:hypothetical protein